MTYQSPRSPQFDPYRGGTTGAGTGISGGISRILWGGVILLVLGWAYLSPAAVANALGIEPPGAEADEFVRNGVLVIAGLVLVIMAIATVARTRRARGEGVPRV
ncbi:MAG: hypothetical protein CVT64_05590 [Actinobacteria bacterium HGW-Actinobacteria-4]|nr:MAG: hypothetical protein CVT64_05590 [Actinobacteria bacterium HGW-Actinobacteria-4]